MKLLPPRETFAWLKALWEHRRNMRISREKLEAKQQKKFRKLVISAYERSDYYRELMDEYDIDPGTCTPTDFPVLTKEDVIEHFDRIVTNPCITRARIEDFLARSSDPTELFENEYHVLHTSGTSGTVGYYVFSHFEWIKGSSHIVRASPLRFGRRIAYVAATRGHFAGASLALTGNHGTNSLFYKVRTLDVSMPMSRIIAELNEYQPHTLSGYAAVLRVLAEAQELGQLQISPLQISTGGEMLTAENKEYIEGVFGVPIVNAYASSEHLFMGLTLPGCDGMYLLEDDLIFELQEDHICVTNLFNHTMPLIRYRMNDLLVPDRNGSLIPFTRVKEVVGRYDNALMFTNEHGEDDFIHPIIIVEFYVRGLNSMQIVLLDKTSFVFRARLEPRLIGEERFRTLAQIRNKMQGILSEKGMCNVTFEVEEVDSLAIDKQTGKFRLVVRAESEDLSPIQNPLTEMVDLTKLPILCKS